MVLTASNFSTIPLQRFQIEVVAEIVDEIHINAYLVLSFPLKLLDESVPDRGSRLVRKAWEVDGNIDAGKEGFVESSNTVRGQEEHALVVLQCAEEDRDEIVALQVHG